MIGIFLDQETTGLDSTRHAVVELAFRVIDLATGQELGSYDSVIQLSEEEWKKSDPQSMKVNGMEWERVLEGKKKELVAQEVKLLLKKVGCVRGKAVFICQNPSFDRPFFAQIISPYEQEKLFWPYHWLDLASMYWALEIQKCTGIEIPDELKLSKDAIAKSLGLSHESRPHKAMGGVDHLVLCYRGCVGFPGEKK